MIRELEHLKTIFNLVPFLLDRKCNKSFLMIFEDRLNKIIENSEAYFKFCKSFE